jgi:hypothetical protein
MNDPNNDGMTLRQRLKEWWTYQMLQFEAGRSQGQRMLEEREERKKSRR